MNILGVSMPEFVFIIILALIILGPKEMQKTGKTIGSFLRKIITSPEWGLIKDAQQKISKLPDQWIREANQDMDKLRVDASMTSKNNISAGKRETTSPFKRPNLEEQKTEYIAENSQLASDKEGGNA